MDDPFSPSETKTLMQQICSATEYLHSNWIMHRDLKTSNLLLNNRGEIKLADFGMARYTSNPPPKLTQLVVTLWYRAPELLLGAEDYGFEIDVWSIGCIFAELLTREPIFQGKNEVGQLSAIFNVLGTPTRESWPGFRSLPNAKALHPLLSNSQSSKSNLTASKFPYLTKAGLRLLLSTLSLDPNDRPSASQILQHPYLKEDPRPKAKEMFPTFPSKAGQERRRRRLTPQAPDRGEAPKMEAGDFASIFARSSEEQSGGGFALRMGWHRHDEQCRTGYNVSKYLLSILPIRSATRCCCLVLVLPFLTTSQRNQSVRSPPDRAKTHRSHHSLQRLRGTPTATLGLTSFESNDSKPATRPASSATASTSSEARAFSSFCLAAAMCGMQVWVDA